MKLFCFLGNIGKEYEKTRHNAGWLCAEFLATQFGFDSAHEEKKFFCFLQKGNINGNSCLFIKPTTYMNLSGKALLAVSQFYKIEPQDIVLVYDDTDMDFGKIRFRAEGSSGGHNGVKDCIRVLGTENIARIKIGIKTESRSKFASTADFVLSNFSSEELLDLQKNIFPAVETLIKEKI